MATAGIIAKDHAGTTLKEDLLSANVNLDFLLEVSSRNGLGTGQTQVIVDREGHRLILVNPGVNERWAKIIKKEKRVDKILNKIQSARVIHLSSFTGAEERDLQESLIHRLHKEAIASLTPGALYSKLGLDRLSEILKRINVLFLYEQQLDTLLENSSAEIETPKMLLHGKLDRLFQWKRKKKFGEPLIVVVVKSANVPVPGVAAPEYLKIACGREVLENLISPETHLSGLDHREVKDTTGAGDALAAGVLFGLLERRGLNKCADIAFVMATLASRELGARAGLPNLRQLQQRCK